MMDNQTKRFYVLKQAVLFMLITMLLLAGSTNARAWVRTSPSQVTACNTAMQASQMLITGWQMNNRKVASTCAYPLAVNNLFLTRPSSQPNAAWRAQGCKWTGLNQASCFYTFEGGAANLSLTEWRASQWQVTSIQFIAD